MNKYLKMKQELDEVVKKIESYPSNAFEIPPYRYDESIIKAVMEKDYEKVEKLREEYIKLYTLNKEIIALREISRPLQDKIYHIEYIAERHLMKEQLKSYIENLSDSQIDKFLKEKF